MRRLALIGFGVTLVGLVVVGAQAADPRCDRRPNHPACQTTTTTVGTTTTSTTTVPPTTTTVPGDCIPSGPITRTGGTVVLEGLCISNPSGDCVVISGASSVTIRNNQIGPCGSYPSVNAKAVYVLSSSNVEVSGNTFANAGRNFVQFDKVTGGSITDNTGENQLGQSWAEDLISLYQSNGTASAPIVVSGNRLRNGGPSGSGSGIMLGDGGGSFQVATGNILVDPGQVGIGVASGTNIVVADNLVYSSSHGWSNVGIYVWNQYGTPCNTISVTGNQVNWLNASGAQNSWWDGGNCNPTVTGNTWGAPIGPEIWELP